MNAVVRRIWPFAAGISLLALGFLSIEARTDWFVATHEDVGSVDPPTGSLILDLDDDADVEDRQRVAEALREAIAPYPWPAQRVGDELSNAAQLFRVEAPASEHEDVLRRLQDEAAVESVEVERYWALPSMGAVPAPDVDAASVGPDVSDGPELFRPNDPYYKHQWHLDQIQMPRAWLRSRGEGAVVAVIDTGVAYEDRTGRRKFTRAPDLAAGSVVPGFDFVDGDDHPNDEHGHGTHVAGTIAQATNNRLGVAGVAPLARIMPLRVLDARGRGSFGNVAAAIRWAADHGADVVNMSLGGGVPSQAVRRAIDYAHGKNVVVVAAAGNSARSRVEYPAMHRHVISVGAVRFDEQLTFYSCHGRGLDLVAPGGDTRVDQNGDGMVDGVLQNTLVRGATDRHDYLGFMGTSMAAPHVAGVAALLRAEGIRDPDTIESILTRSAKDKKNRRQYGAGLLQADDALALAQRGFGGLRGLGALVLGLSMMLALRGRRRLAVAPLPTTAVAICVAGGLAALPWHWLPVGHGLTGLLATFTSGLPSGLAAVSVPWIAPLLLSATIPFALAALFLGWRRATPVVAGTAVAFAAWLAIEALVPTAEIGLLPTWLVGPWLLTQAMVCACLAYLAATKPSHRSL